MKNKSVAWAKKTNAIGMKLKEGCPPITYNVEALQQVGFSEPSADE